MSIRSPHNVNVLRSALMRTIGALSAHLPYRRDMGGPLTQLNAKWRLIQQRATMHATQWRSIKLAPIKEMFAQL
jgi:hypothetical protein